MQAKNGQDLVIGHVVSINFIVVGEDEKNGLALIEPVEQDFGGIPTLTAVKPDALDIAPFEPIVVEDLENFRLKRPIELGPANVEKKSAIGPEGANDGALKKTQSQK